MEWTSRERESQYGLLFQWCVCGLYALLRPKQMSLFSLSLYGELNIFSFEFFIRYIIKFIFIINLSRYIADIFLKKNLLKFRISDHAALFLDGEKQCFLPRRGNVTENDGGLCLIAWLDARPVEVWWGGVGAYTHKQKQRTANQIESIGCGKSLIQSWCFCPFTPLFVVTVIKTVKGSLAPALFAHSFWPSVCFTRAMLGREWFGTVVNVLCLARWIILFLYYSFNYRQDCRNMAQCHCKHYCQFVTGWELEDFWRY